MPNHSTEEIPGSITEQGEYTIRYPLPFTILGYSAILLVLSLTAFVCSLTAVIA